MNDDHASSILDSALDVSTSLVYRPITVAIDPVALVVTECITVTSAMRKHARWAHSSVSAILGGAAASTRTPPQSPRKSRPTSLEEEAVTNRWGLRGKKGKSLQDNPLMAAFARLRSDLKGCKGTLFSVS